ncbi:AZG1 [Symbiodinium sp. CCMP2592]|nr:AZG1 [Symbiodinium sp. CCMP2592]
MGISVADPATLVKLGSLSSSSYDSSKMWMALLVLVVTATLLSAKIPGAPLIGIVLGTVVCWIEGWVNGVEGSVFGYPFGTEGDRSAKDFHIFVPHGVVASPHLSGLTGALFEGFDWAFHPETSGTFWTAVATFCYTDLLDSSGTFFAVAKVAGLTDARGNLPLARQNMAYLADALSMMIGSVLGVSTVSTFAESTAGVADGAKTGLASLVTGSCFLLAIPFSPIVSAVPPLASGPILCLLGAMMCSSVKGVDWDDFQEALPAFVAMITMPFTFSIGYGIIAGLALWIAIQLLLAPLRIFRGESPLVRCKMLWAGAFIEGNDEEQDGDGKKTPSTITPEQSEGQFVSERWIQVFCPRPEGSVGLSLELERFRQAFREEAGTCLETLREAMRTAGIAQLHHQFAEQHKNDTADIQKLREHVEELFRLNARLRQQTLDQLGKDEMERCRDYMTDTCDAMKRMLDSQLKDQQLRVASAAELAADRAALSCTRMVQAEWPTLKEMWRMWRQEDQERWTSLSSQIAELQNQLQQTSKELHSASEQHRSDLSTQLADVEARVIAQMTASMKEELTAANASLLGDFPGHLRGLQAEVQTLPERLAAAVAADAPAPGAPAEVVEALVAQQLGGLHKTLEDEVVPCLHGCSLQNLSDKLEDALQVEEMRREVLRSSQEAEVAKIHSRNFEVEMSDLRLELGRLKASMHDTSRLKEEAERIQRELLQKVREIEGRGNLQIDLQRGCAEVTKGFDFKSKKSDDSDIRFADAAAGAQSMADLMQLQELLNVPMVVEGHINGRDGARLQVLTDCRAKLVRSELIKKGMQPECVAAKGLPGSKGVNRPCVLVRFDLGQNRR